MTLFPDLMPAPAPVPPARAGSLDTLATSATDNDVRRPDPGTPPGRSPSKVRPRVTLPPHPRTIDRRDPDREQASAAVRSSLSRDAADAIRGYLGTLNLAALPAGLRAIADSTIIRERVGPALVRETTRGDKLRRWLLTRASSMDACQDVRAFREAQCGTYAVQPHSCRVRICPDCERSRSMKAVRVMKAILETVPRRRRSFVVLTIRNTRELQPGLDQLDAAIASLRRRPIFRGGACRWRTRDGRPGHPCAHKAHRRDRNCPDFQHRAVAGGARFTEVTYSVERGDWHPHANLLLDAPFIAQAELSDTWRGITCSDAKHRRAGWCPKECDRGSHQVWIEQVSADTVREAVKYVTKATDLIEGDDPSQLVEFMIATRNRRMAQGFGSFWNLELEEPDETEETVAVAVPTGDHDQLGRPIVIRYRLPRICRFCKRDTKIDDETCTYELPIVVPRVEARLRSGTLSWRPPPRRFDA